ncbi:hypothetical protein TL16_g08886 [Triparma laevis f. inornata]|uniref:Tyrosine-protein kinase ephrin type A/B receptor-like domain-containing protein n=1 Tax=Triparma laevis f. inornata TaxID=1714386 RepID=A0A9W7AYN5_9STRA|nr:hypothetical protein TL16_g08886 [Triparma laevis f. inornata]
MLLAIALLSVPVTSDDNKCNPYANTNDSCKANFQKDQTGLCTCTPGFTLDKTSCIACEGGKYKDTYGIGVCLACASNYIKNSWYSDKINYPILNSSSSCICGQTYYRDKAPKGSNLDFECKKCPENTLCYYELVEETALIDPIVSPDIDRSLDFRGLNLTQDRIELGLDFYSNERQLTIETLPIEAGYWRWNNKTANLFECASKFACPASRDGSTTCSDVTDTSFPLCEVCKDGASKNSLGVCEECEPMGVMVLICFSILLGMVLSLYIFCWLNVYVFILTEDQKVNFPRYFPKPTLLWKTFRDSPNKTDDGKHWGQRLRTYFKVLISFYQIASSLPNTLATSYPKIYTDFTLYTGPIVNLKVMSLDCFWFYKRYGYYGTFGAVILVPILVVLLGWLVVYPLALCRYPESKARIKKELWNLFYIYSFIIYSHTSTTALSMFDCEHFHDLDADVDDNKAEFLKDDRSIDCSDDNADYQIAKAIACLAVVMYPIGISCMYAYQLWKHRDAIKNEETRDDNPAIESIGFLWKDYRPQYWWFELFENLRRFCFTAAAKMEWFPNGSPLQLALLLLIAHICIYVYGLNCPFQENEENWTARFGQWAIFFQLLLALVASARDKTPPEGTYNISENDVWGVILVILNCTVVSLVGLGMGWPFIVKWYQSREEIYTEGGQSLTSFKNYKEDKDNKEKSDDTHFIEYYKKVAQSQSGEGVADWGALPEGSWKTWCGVCKKSKIHEDEVLRLPGFEWRCAKGNGPIDQGRVKFVVNMTIDEVAIHIRGSKNYHKTAAGRLISELGNGPQAQSQRQLQGLASARNITSQRQIQAQQLQLPPDIVWRQTYSAINVGWGWPGMLHEQRDFIVHEFMKEERMGDGMREVIICSKSSPNSSDLCKDLSVQNSRTRAEKMTGYLLKEHVSKETGQATQTEITFVAEFNLGGRFSFYQFGKFYRNFLAWYLHDEVEMWKKVEKVHNDPSRRMTDTFGVDQYLPETLRKNDNVRGLIKTQSYVDQQTRNISKKIKRRTNGVGEGDEGREYRLGWG